MGGRGVFETPVILKGFRVSYDGRFEWLPSWTGFFEGRMLGEEWLVSILRIRGLIFELTRAL